MRYRTIAAAIVLTTGLSGASYGAEVNEQGAKDLRNSLSAFLPHDVASTFLSVKPVGNRYEVTYDLTKLLDRFPSPDFTISGLKPLTMFAAPAEKGLWNIDGDNSLDISAHSKLGDGPATDIQYQMGSMVYSGVFDPAISYMRSLDATARDFRMSSISGAQKVEAGAAGMTYKFSSIDTARPGTVDMLASGAMPSFYEKIAGQASGNAEIKADNMTFDAKATGVPINALRDLIRFVFEHAEAKKLSKRGGEKFQTLVRNALPLFGSLEETAVASNLSVLTDVGTASLDKLTYSFKMNGLTEASSIGFGLRAEKLKLASGLVPEGYEALVPDTTVVEVGIPDMNFAAAADILLNTDFSTPEGLSTESGRKIGSAIFPNDKLTIDFPEISAVSSVYDIAVSGKVVSNLQQTNRYALQMSVLARDYDKTIAFVQNAAKTDAELNQISFGMMMAKGFAKTDPDGRQRWDVTVTEDGAFTVNGQVITPAK
ncbi:MULTISPECIES: hypothetical protein [unclassified Rhizobium]|uniref:hypothetical protein n=1 Tax=unclassified Rhizobium TaxID=2613769 RepID=UPI001ADB4004|nr:MULTISPECIES: hypothetical protein [unclassified Rhizobium]MBO9099043.1 hypothetical protein [Rhizobium sp. L58/93]MBO9132150.1 hypothetical protein [Rhizobium sp. B209b/85]MBO9169306.1 hypothetical protein [Rhizobium sp. L245/93]MBO9185258.1 hypothetical protein [Rhizobium sp. E27B/91]QXZ85401.1 hypothetical protein J5287_07810 [Rhizobium sp. K1/93]